MQKIWQCQDLARNGEAFYYYSLEGFLCYHGSKLKFGLLMCSFQEFEGRILKLDWAKPKEKTNPVAQKPKPAPIHNLFVANLPYQARAKDLKEFFNSENGNAVSADVIFHENPRRSAGYGFVSFYTKQEAEAALSAFQGKVIWGFVDSAK